MMIRSHVTESLAPPYYRSNAKLHYSAVQTIRVDRVELKAQWLDTTDQHGYVRKWLFSLE